MPCRGTKMTATDQLDSSRTRTKETCQPRSTQRGSERGAVDCSGDPWDVGSRETDAPEICRNRLRQIKKSPFTMKKSKCGKRPKMKDKDEHSLKKILDLEPVCGTERSGEFEGRPQALKIRSGAGGSFQPRSRLLLGQLPAKVPAGQIPAPAPRQPISALRSEERAGCVSAPQLTSPRWGVEGRTDGDTPTRTQGLRGARAGGGEAGAGNGGAGHWAPQLLGEGPGCPLPAARQHQLTGPLACGLCMSQVPRCVVRRAWGARFLEMLLDSRGVP